LPGPLFFFFFLVYTGVLFFNKLEGGPPPPRLLKPETGVILGYFFPPTPRFLGPPGLPFWGRLWRLFPQKFSGVGPLFFPSFFFFGGSLRGNQDSHPRFLKVPFSNQIAFFFFTERAVGARFSPAKTAQICAVPLLLGFSRGLCYFLFLYSGSWFPSGTSTTPPPLVAPPPPPMIGHLLGGLLWLLFFCTWGATPPRGFPQRQVPPLKKTDQEPKTKKGQQSRESKGGGTCAH